MCTQSGSDYDIPDLLHLGLSPRISFGHTAHCTAWCELLSTLLFWPTWPGTGGKTHGARRSMRPWGLPIQVCTENFKVAAAEHSTEGGAFWSGLCTLALMMGTWQRSRLKPDLPWTMDLMRWEAGLASLGDIFFQAQFFHIPALYTNLWKCIWWLHYHSFLLKRIKESILGKYHHYFLFIEKRIKTGRWTS